MTNTLIAVDRDLALLHLANGLAALLRDSRAEAARHVEEALELLAPVATADERAAAERMEDEGGPSGPSEAGEEA